jgi:hypothetical protein
LKVTPGDHARRKYLALAYQISFARQIDPILATVKKLIEDETYYGGVALPKLPVAIIDDFATLYLLLMLYEKKAPGRLVYPFGNEAFAEKTKSQMPEYLISIAAKRTHAEIGGYLQRRSASFFAYRTPDDSSFYGEACK